MDQIVNGIQSEEFSAEKESSTKRRSTLFSSTISSSRKVNTMKIGQLPALQNKRPLSRKTHEQPNDRSQEKINSASRVTISATTKRIGLASALTDETTNTQTSVSKQPTRLLRSSVHKTSAIQQGSTKTTKSPVTQTDASTRCKNSSSEVPETSTPVVDSPKRRKSKTSESRPSTKSNRSSSLTKGLSTTPRDEPIAHIKWDGFSRTRENVGVTCALCEEDLSYMPADYEYEYYEDPESEPVNYPEVAILPCGHSFHIRCFNNTIPPDEHCTDPPCVFCASFLD